LTKPVFAIAADVVFPLLVGLAAGAVAMATVRTLPAIVLSSFFITFGSDIFSLNSSIFGFGDLYLTKWFQTFEVTVRQYFLDVFSSYLSLYRTLEPQLSLSVFLFHVANLINCLRSDPMSRSRIFLVTGTGLVCAGAYAFFSMAAALLGCAAVLSLLIAGEKRRATCLFFSLGMGLLFTFGNLATSYEGEAASMLYSSRLPLFSVSMIFGFLGVLVIIVQYRDTVFKDPLLLFSMALLLFPVAVLNQQVVTGVMVQAANWERYVNMVCVVVGLLVSFGGQRMEARAPNVRFDVCIGRRFSIPVFSVVVILLTAVASVLFLSLLDNYRRYAQFNLQTIAYAQAIDQAIDQHGLSIRKVILDNMAIDAPVQARLETTGIDLFGYTALVSGLTKSDQSSATFDDLESPVSKEKEGFDLAARLGLSPKQYEAALAEELATQACWPHLMYLADFLECAPYVSDFRHYRLGVLEERISEAVASYTKYLASHAFASDTPALIFSLEPLLNEDGNDTWQVELLRVTQLSTSAEAFAPSLSTKIFAYVQRPARPLAIRGTTETGTLSAQSQF
jgi:type II secretory pathway pseudopilin PulG